ncbi:ankyrin repeat domain-containing protein [Sediminivirga luteola]|uniref:Ankyrin repeat protein n=1 Tax=Sediminivirga luteola TaxID=1774748 RepID=A0A8J2XGV6_9MICO|nr:ankyrin repeat domain-containing protein [Sediminivirga luteola]MCI2265813.1 ankyrin repeat domain-containing protein [Sediminivirga luteola]GGA14435.1 hypothetical protein GCM10011333_16690 [Sediminivirga luteola]
MRLNRAWGMGLLALAVGAAGYRLLPGRHPSGRYFDDERVVELLRAAEKSNRAAITAALEAGADLDAVGNDADPRRTGISPLHYAVEFSSPEAVRLLLEAGADPRAQSQELNGGFCVPAYAVLRDATENLAVLLEHDPSLADAPFRSFGNLLHGAVLHDRAAALRLLIDAGAELDSADPATGRTPLHTAANVRNVGACLTLVRAGADAGARDIHGRTFLPVLFRNDERSSAEFLRVREELVRELQRRRFPVETGL